MRLGAEEGLAVERRAAGRDEEGSVGRDGPVPTDGGRGRMGAPFVGEPKGAAPGQGEAAVARKAMVGGRPRAIDVG